MNLMKKTGKTVLVVLLFLALFFLDMCLLAKGTECYEQSLDYSAALCDAHLHGEPQGVEAALNKSDALAMLYWGVGFVLMPCLLFGTAYGINKINENPRVA